MNRALAEKLLPIVNDPYLYPALLQYAQWRMDLAQRDIPSAQDLRALGMVQGRMHEMTHFRSLKEAVLQHAKDSP